MIWAGHASEFGQRRSLSPSFCSTSGVPQDGQSAGMTHSRSAPVRAANVADAFTVYGHQRLDDRSVLLIDDVWTSGATARATAAALRAAGARAVDVLTLARVL